MVKFSPVDTSLVASAGTTNGIRIWNLRNDTVTAFRGHRGQINSIAFSPDGQLLASGSDDWTFKLWDVHTQQHIATLEHITGRTRSPITEVAFSHDGQLLATAGQHVKLWEVSTQTEIATLQHSNYVSALAFSPDGQFLATGDVGGTVKIWDIQERQVISQLDGDTVRIDTLTFSPDGRTLASAGYHGLIKLWGVSDWTMLGTLQNRGTAYTLDFSPDGKALVSTGHAAVTLWSVENGEEITSLTGHSGWVFGAAFSPDGKTLASGGDDGIVRVQNIESYLQTLQQREMVRLIYFLPINRSAQHDIDTKLDTLIRDVQQFYVEQMHNHGFGRKTFSFETDATGKAVVHHVNGKFTDRYYDTETLDKVIEEIEERFSLSTNLYLISIETGSEKIDVQWCGRGGTHGTTGGRAIVPASGSCFVGDHGLETAAHELGHAFGLDHDFRDDAYLMSYGSDRDQLSFCAAEWLDAHRYFNTHQTSFNEPTTLTMYMPLALPSNVTRFRFEAADADGLHQAQLTIPVAIGDPADGVKLHSCQALDGEISRIEFTTTEVTPGFATEVTLRVIDVYGNFTQETYPLRVGDVARVDTDGDGVVDVADLVLVASHFGRVVVRGAASDVNNDGLVNREDLLLVVEALESQESAPAAPTLTSANLQRWILEAKRRNFGDETFQKGIRVLEQLLTPFHPTETALLPNYPNPFNPETWIPYQLAKPADVSIAIYAADGKLVRTLALGHQPIGIYQGKSRAAYWDGKNALGEPVAGGVYFYQLKTDEMSSVRKMVILK
ncbi:MAG: dockerin type I domain-containing protein [Candidatus Poribacteria bacterium]|nr:dockerin type I domain-containing protein [Candidatus Poribacteria bacterium]